MTRTARVARVARVARSEQQNGGLSMDRKDRRNNREKTI